MRVVAGPGAYEAKQTLQPKGGLMVTRDKRFKYNADDLPGPGAYEVRCSTPLRGGWSVGEGWGGGITLVQAGERSSVGERRFFRRHAFLE